MQVGIIGLRSKQVEVLSSRRFNGIKVDFYGHAKYTREHIDNFCRGADKVIVLQNLVPNNDQKLVPREKRILALGSVGSIVRVLEKFEKPVEVVEAPKVDKQSLFDKAAKDVAEAFMARQLESPTPPAGEISSAEWRAPLMTTRNPSTVKSVFTNIADKREIKYVYRDDIVVERCKPNGVQNYKILGAVQLGDIVRFERPMKVNASVWKARIQTARSYYKRKMGIEFEAHFYGNMVDLLATNVPLRGNILEDDEIRKELTRTPVELPPGVEFGSPEHIEIVRQALNSLQPKGNQVPVVEPAPAEQPPVAEAEPVVEEKVAYNALQRSFWKRAYLACLSSGNTPVEAEMKADAALRAHDQRFS